MSLVGVDRAPKRLHHYLPVLPARITLGLGGATAARWNCVRRGDDEARSPEKSRCQEVPCQRTISSSRNSAPQRNTYLAITSGIQVLIVIGLVLFRAPP